MRITEDAFLAALHDGNGLVYTVSDVVHRAVNLVTAEDTG